MKITRGFKYRLVPTEQQKDKLLQHGGNARFIWNLFLSRNIDLYNRTGKFEFFVGLASLLPNLKTEFPFLMESFSQSLQNVAKQFDTSLKRYLKGLCNFPKYKEKLSFSDSFTCPQCWRIEEAFVFIPKVGEVKWIKHRPMRGKPKKITISQDGNKWYCSVLCEYEVIEQNKKSDNIIGCDVGIKEFAVLSDGNIISNPKYFDKHLQKLIKEQRKLSKKKVGSNNYFKQRMKVRKVYNKIRDTRKDFLHKVTFNLKNKYDGVIVEDLNIESMLSNSYLAKSISDASWGEFKRQLKYKCIESFKHFILIDKFVPTSKKCSECGHIQNMPLSKRIYNCPVCGLLMDRDLNAAINIRDIGLNTAGLVEIKACEDKDLFLSMKQENVA